MSDQTPPDNSVPAEGRVTPPADADLWSGPAPAAASAPSASSQPSMPGRRRSLLVGLVAVLAAGAVVVGVLFAMGGGSSDEADDVISSSDDVTTTAAPETTVLAAVPASSVAPPSTPATTSAPTTTTPPTTTAAPTTTVAPPTTPAGPAYPTLPDGSPAPIVAIYDGPTIRVTGWVPSVEKAAQLEALALANSNDPAAQVESTWVVDPSVPTSIGTRVIEMNSPRFAPGSAAVTPEHSLQLDRVAGVMNLLPNVTVTVIGHADQQGDPAANYVLSEARAVSVVRYLVGQGVDPARLSARAVGDQDLLSEDESEASLALNRRTEFVFVGLLAD